MSSLGNESSIADIVCNLEENCLRFSLTEIQSATNNFDDDALFIAEGGFGKVYKGYINGETIPVAIKRLKTESKQGADEFWMEITILSKLHHENLVTLIGYCNDLEEMILVYEYVCNGTLADHLYKLHREGKSAEAYHLSWEERLNICIGAAHGLAHLHEEIEQNVIHRDVKTSNILLDENWRAKLSDFGISKLCPMSESHSHVSTEVKGSFGYFDPEYFATHKLTKKSDVYAFGVVLFEVLCARPPVDRHVQSEQCNLAQWAHKCFKKGTLDQIMDGSIKEKISPHCLKMFTEVAIKCLHVHPKGRPTMVEVARSLELVLVSQIHLPPPKGIFRKAFACVAMTAPKGIDIGWRKKEKYFWRRFSKDPFLVKAIQFHRFSLAEVRAATNEFDANKIIARNGHARVYRGILEHGNTMIAIKRWEGRTCQTENDSLDQFRCEMMVQSKIRHLHIIPLIGYCNEDNELVLVYNYMTKGSLYEHLHTNQNDPLPWEKRLEIITSAARGVHYLHAGTQQTIIHRNLKTNNIFLDENWMAKISSLEFCSMLPNCSSSSSLGTVAPRTKGYLDPEYPATGKLTKNSDVFSFGVVLLEILCGRKAFVVSPDADQVDLVRWFQVNIELGTVRQIIDQNLINQVAPHCFDECIKIAEDCVCLEGARRPSMEDVLGRLWNVMQLQKSWSSCPQLEQSQS